MNEFDFRKFLSLGREVSEHHEEFKFLAPLGNEAAEQRAILEYISWLEKNGKEDILSQLKKAVELIGMAQMLPLIKEVGRFCLILGDTSHKEDWSKLE